MRSVSSEEADSLGFGRRHRPDVVMGSQTFHIPPKQPAAVKTWPLAVATVLMVVMVLLVPLAWSLIVIAYALFLGRWTYRRSVVYIHDRSDRARCMCCRDNYPVVWVESRLPVQGYWPAYDPEFHLCERHMSRWLKIMALEREVLS